MTNTAKSIHPHFVVNTGDNFYWCGIQNVSDFQVQVDWIEPYADASLQIPWYSILGNHEYGYNVDAQIELTQKYTNWVMDSRYYTRRIEVDVATKTFISFIFLDTSPCISSYRSSAQSGWDPCSTTYPTCSLGSTDDDFEGICKFHENILQQSCDKQYDWLANALKEVPKDDWLIIVGHHPADEINVLDFTSLIQSHGFSYYFNGHSHALTRYSVDGSGIYVTSGAGALVNTPDQLHPVTAAKVAGEQFINSTLTSTTTSSHSYKTIANYKIAGFTSHLFSSDFMTLTTNFISYTGDVLYSFNSNKAGKEV